ncbi:hypothetical protein A167_01386 [Alcanivorax sp. S71-1-4]|uniref:hypothetical protein n=1 Tax=Alcanivorax sp. S71-1-4 TaxID=1177159 RepID=UPI001358BB28|nr:hypothetical protein [Alcanivorax sp. S71-1-4]KAF0809846.1 hypothetical protein A167_01386 [Alcanivorax sp. S71-1-4]
MPDSHDQNFKNLILDYPRQALELFAPEEAATLDDAVVITPIREEQLKDRLSDRFLALDIPLLLEWPDGRREALLFVIEQQTESSRFSVHKLARYSLSLAELFKTDRVVPVVVFLKRAGGVPEAVVLGNELHDYLHFRYIRCVLPDLAAEQYLESPNLVARLNLPNMRWPPELKLGIYASAIRGLESLESNPDKRIKYTAFVDIYTELNNNERLLFEQHYQREASAVTGFAERFEQQGLKRGLEQGLEEAQRREREARLTIARKLIRTTSMDDASIAETTELPEADIQAMRQEAGQ